MKKAVKVIAIVMAVICLVALFTACNSSGGISFRKAKIALTYEPSAVSAADRSGLIGKLDERAYSGESANGILFVGRKLNALNENAYTVYNVATGVTLVEDTTDTVSVYSFGDYNAYYTISKADVLQGTRTTTLYTGNGTALKCVNAAGEETNGYVTSSDDPVPAVTVVTSDIILFGNCYYRLSRTSCDITFIRAKTGLFSFNTNITNSNDKYYYNITANRALVFDKNLDLVSSYYAHGNYNASSIFVLESGDLLVQLTYARMDDSKDYTYINGVNKFLLKTYVVNAKDGSAKEKDVDFLVLALDSDFSDNNYSFNGSARNFAQIRPIEDEMLMTGANDTQRVLLTNSLSIKGRVDQMVDGQTPNTVFNPLNENLRFNTPAGTKLYTTGGKEIGSAAGIDDFNDNYIVTSGKLYDNSLNLVFDYTAAGYSLYQMMAHNVILSKTVIGVTHYYLYKGGDAPIDLNPTANLAFKVMNDHFYEIATTDNTMNETTYTYYNENGDAILSGLKANLIEMSSATAYEAYLYYANVPVTGGAGGTVRQYYRIG